MAYTKLSFALLSIMRIWQWAKLNFHARLAPCATMPESELLLSFVAALHTLSLSSLKLTSKYVGKLVQHTKDSEDDAGSEVMAAIRDGKKSDSAMCCPGG